MLAEVLSGNDVLVVEGEYPNVTPATLFRYWTEPTLLKQWWPEEAEIDPREGGAFVLSWPKMEWRLRGTYSTFEPGQRLAFTWKWDHEPDTPVRHVHVALEPSSDGTKLTISHGPYRDSEIDQQEREGHLEGWQFFCGRLREVTSSPPV